MKELFLKKIASDKFLFTQMLKHIKLIYFFYVTKNLLQNGTLTSIVMLLEKLLRSTSISRKRLVDLLDLRRTPTVTKITILTIFLVKKWSMTEKSLIQKHRDHLTSIYSLKILDYSRLPHALYIQNNPKSAILSYGWAVWSCSKPGVALWVICRVSFDVFFLTHCFV